jgi:Putative peptidoglycan binding domain
MMKPDPGEKTMAVECLCFPGVKGTGCFVVNDADEIAIEGSVGAGGKNASTDVRTIQAALNDVSPEDGGPSPALAVDGFIGPLTIAAIKKFQQKHVPVVDSRIDPHGPTLAALNDESGTAPIAPQQALQAVATPQSGLVGEFLPPDPVILAVVGNLIGKVRATIAAARFKLDMADNFVTTKKLKIPTAPLAPLAASAVTLLDIVFDLGEFANPRPPFENIKRVFSNMDVALNRAFRTAPPASSVLFAPNTHISMEIHFAYTAVGGAFLSPKTNFGKLKGHKELADRIYVCRRMMTLGETDQISILIHELAHYVSGQPIKVGDVSTGRMLDGGRRLFDELKPEEKIRSAEHYSFFAMTAKFPRLLETV